MRKTEERGMEFGTYIHIVADVSGLVLSGSGIAGKWEVQWCWCVCLGWHIIILGGDPSQTANCKPMCSSLGGAFPLPLPFTLAFSIAIYSWIWVKHAKHIAPPPRLCIFFPLSFTINISCSHASIYLISISMSANIYI